MSSGFPTRSDTNRAVQPQKMARGLKFRIKEVEDVAKPIFTFVFAYAKFRFSHDTAHIKDLNQTKSKLLLFLDGPDNLEVSGILDKTVHLPGIAKN